MITSLEEKKKIYNNTIFQIRNAVNNLYQTQDRDLQIKTLVEIRNLIPLLVRLCWYLKNTEEKPSAK